MRSVSKRSEESWLLLHRDATPSFGSAGEHLHVQTHRSGHRYHVLITETKVPLHHKAKE